MMHCKTSLKNWSTLKQKLSRLSFIMIGLFFVISVFGGWSGAWFFTNYSGAVKLVDFKATAAGQNTLWSTIAKNLEPSVVSINISSIETDNSLALFGLSTSQQSQAAGTGIILSSNGIILTNRHVVTGNGNIQNISVTTNNGTTYNHVTILATDPRSNFDVAFLKIKNVNGLKPAKIGDSSKMMIGDSVLAIGNALGQFSNTVTNGIISGVNRPIVASDTTDSSESLTNLFQTDAAINPGNSGGPLVNLDGQVIGLNTAVASNAQNIGFSIPINDIEPEIDSILRTGKLAVPFLGISYVMLNQSIQSQNHLPVSSGAWLQPSVSGGSAIISNSPAAQAGLKTGDIITKINGQTVDNDHTPSSIINQYTINDTIQISFLRNGQAQQVKVILKQLPTSLNL
jgi:serine protease Do